MTITLKQLIAHLRPVEVLGEADAAAIVGAIVADSRAITPGDVFVAVSGGQVDGHAYLGDAARRGAIALVGTLSPGEANAPHNVPYLHVADSRIALAEANALLYGFPSRAMTVIGVTGTDGKTTTSSLLESILVAATRSADFPRGRVGVVTTVGARIQGAESDTGLHVTTPDAPEVQRFLAEMRDAGCTCAVVESTSHGLAQKRVAAVDFDVAVVTNITHEHLDYHGTRDAYVAAKAMLFRSLFHSSAKGAIPRAAILNADDDGSFDALRAAIAEEQAACDVSVQVRTYGWTRTAPEGDAGAPDASAAAIDYRADGTTFTFRWGDPFVVESRLIGEFNVANVLAAATAALAIGLPVEAIRRGIAEFPGVLGRMERMDRGQPFTAIVDFAHSPASLERALQTLRPLVGAGTPGAPGRLIAVFGSAGLRDKAKRRWMGQVSGRLADFTVVTAEDPRTEDVNDICREIEAGVREYVDASRCVVIPDRTEAIQFAVDMAHEGDIVASFGKGHERSMCYGVTEYPWSDQDAMLGALERRMSRTPLVKTGGVDV